MQLALADRHDTLSFEFNDDGVGLPERFDVETGSGTGMSLIRHLCEQLGAECSWDSSDLGVRFSMSIPAHRTRHQGHPALRVVC
jgi:two-component sensor histidine kinase